MFLIIKFTFRSKKVETVGLFKTQKKTAKLARGFTLIETLIGVALMLLIFVSFVYLLQSSIKLTGVSKAKSGALALANEQIEMIRNLPYDDIGTVGGIPSGNILSSESISLNTVNYTRRVLIQYIDDAKDGLAGADVNGIITDYKRVKVEVSWQGKEVSSLVSLIADVMPKGLETTVGGGTLIINVFDASIQPVSLANVHIENASATPAVNVDVFTNSFGQVMFPGTPAGANYEIVVTKPGYSVAKTYNVDAQNINPNPGHLNILQGQTTQASFSIGLTGSKTVSTVGAPGEASWSDLFVSSAKIASSTGIIIDSGEARLNVATSTSGFLISTLIAPQYLDRWKEFSWSDSRPSSTTIKYHISYVDNGNWVLVPEIDLPGNSVGFSAPTVDLSSISTSTYPTLNLRADLESENASTTPSIFDWNISWLTTKAPIASVAFNMRGAKIIGENGGGADIYKYDQNLSTGSVGTLTISDLEWDTYTITIDGVTTGYDISESCPIQSLSIVPAGSGNTLLTLSPSTTNSLLAMVMDASGSMIQGASVRLFKAGYDQIQNTSECGQTFYSSLTSAPDYNIEVTKNGYQNFSLSNVSVNGPSQIKVIMTP